MNGRWVYVSCAIALIAISALAPVAHAQLVSAFQATTVFSPNADGDLDSTRVTFRIEEDSPSVSLIVFQSDSSTVVDTLVAPGPLALGRHDVFWGGRDFNGTPAAEGFYIVTLTAQGVAEPDTSASKPLFLDVTPPRLDLLSVDPSVFVPGVAGKPQKVILTFTLTDGSPTFGGLRDADQMLVSIARQDGSPVVPDSITFSPPFDGSDGLYKATWNGKATTTILDGGYTITMTVNDYAGFSDSRSGDIYIDKDSPKVEITNVTALEIFRVLPDSVRGWTWDANGIEVGSLAINYRDAGVFSPVTSVFTVDDTVFFSAVLADSFPTAGDHKINVRSVDKQTREKLQGRTFTLDTTAPAPPSLDPFSGVWHGTTFIVSGTWQGEPEFIRIYQNNVLVDSVSTILLTRFDRPQTLAPGSNTFFATAVDKAKNESQPSNQIFVRFDDASGLFVPAPFTPDDAFNVNVSRDATGVTLRVYDLGGDLVASLEEASAGRNYSIGWDGRNGGGNDVKKGPLVAVAVVDFTDGQKRVFRELFLYDPTR